jgi:uncharacterized protein YhaN
MRLNRLDLIRYGRFQDFALDFGQAEPGRPDVTVVYGANEAGKSTAFMAWLDFLFGFQGASPYAFRHERRELLVGAQVATPDGRLDLRRSTATAGSLTDQNGNVIADRRMTDWLFGLDRDAYRTRFSLNDTVLREGGKEIAQAQGDLGQLLHAGASGLSGLSDALAGIEGEVAGFYRKGGRTTAANEGRKRLKDLDAAIRNVRLDPRAFDRLAKARDDADAAFSHADAGLADARRALKLREAADRRRDMARRIAAMEAELADAPDGPDLPAEAVARVASAAEKCAGAEESLARARANTDAATARLAALSEDPVGQQVAAHLEMIDTAVFGEGELLVPRVVTNSSDLPKRRQDRDDILARMAGLAVDLPGASADPGAIVLGRDVLGALRRSADDVRTSRATLDGETRARLSAEADQGERTDPPEGLDRLADALQLWHQAPDPHDSLLALATAQAAVGNQTAGLPPDWRALAEAGLPEATEIEAVTEAVQLAESDRTARARAEQEAANAREAALKARDTLAGRPDIVLDVRAAESRARRDQAWAAHRAGLDPETADTFADAMRDDDSVQSRHAASTEARLRYSASEAELDARTVAHEEKRAALAEAETLLQAAADAAAAMAVQIGLPPSAPVKALRPRRDGLAEALRAIRQAEAAGGTAEKLRAERLARLGALREALGANEALPLDDRLPAIAERALVKLKDQRTAANDWRNARKTIDRMTASEADAAERLSGFQTALASRLAGLRCSDLDAGRLLDCLPDMEKLAELDEQRLQLDHRIEAMESAIASFEPLARPLRDLLGLTDVAHPNELLAMARQRAAQAEKTAQAVAAERKQLDAASDAGRGAEAARAAGRAEITRILAGQACDAAADPVDMVNRLEARDRLRRSLREARAAFDAEGGDFDPDALAAEEADHDPVRTDALREDVGEADRQRDVALERRSQARQSLETALAGDGGIAPDQERAALVETLRQGGREALARQFGLLAARSALRRFRQAHRGAMIEATEQAFAGITGGSWPRLDIQTVGANERLVGLRNGEPVAVGAMSTGTQGQLYLALRIAGHAQFVAEHGPLPFVTDDIHETFDDERVGAALRLAASMGERGQTILFTHHRHVVGLARSVIPSVNVLEIA